MQNFLTHIFIFNFLYHPLPKINKTPRFKKNWNIFKKLLIFCLNSHVIEKLFTKAYLAAFLYGISTSFFFFFVRKSRDELNLYSNYFNLNKILFNLQFFRRNRFLSSYAIQKLFFKINCNGGKESWRKIFFLKQDGDSWW